MPVNKNINKAMRYEPQFLRPRMTRQTEIPIRLRMQLGMLSKSYLISLNLLLTAI